MPDDPQTVEGQELSAQSVGSEHIYEAWSEATSPVFRTVPAVDDHGFDARLEAYNLEGLVVTRVRFAASRFERTPAMLKQDEGDCITIQHYLSGSNRGHVGDHDLHMAPDRISFHDFAVPYAGWAEPSEVLGVTIPRDLVTSAEEIRTRRPMFSFPLRSAPGALLASALEVLWGQLRDGSVEDPRTLSEGFMGLVNGLLDSSGEPLGPDQARLAMEQHLRRHLGDPNLGVTHLRDEFHWSRSAIYRLFEPHGGVGAFIRNERLRQVHAELSRPHAGQVPIGKIAARYGFHDRSQFARAFRREYGVAPSELVRERAEAPAPTGSGPGGRHAAAQTIKSWLVAV